MDGCTVATMLSKTLPMLKEQQRIFPLRQTSALVSPFTETSPTVT